MQSTSLLPAVPQESNNPFLNFAVTLVEDREHWRPLAASCSRASTGSGSSPSWGGSGKGGVKVGEGQDQDVPRQEKDNDIMLLTVVAV